jgi:hypothetical protein
MENEHPSLEADLAALAPGALDEDFLIRLQACAEGTWSELLDDEIHFELRMRAFAPAALDASYLDKLEAVCTDTFHANQAGIIQLGQHRSFWKSRSGLAAAAAIALLGAATALLVPPSAKKSPGTIAEIAKPAPVESSSNFIPAGYNRNLSEARSEGVIWRNREPHRIVRIVYTERVTLNNSKGERIEVEQPRVEYVIVPAKVD